MINYNKKYTSVFYYIKKKKSFFTFLFSSYKFDRYKFFQNKFDWIQMKHSLRFVQMKYNFFCFYNFKND